MTGSFEVEGVRFDRLEVGEQRSVVAAEFFGGSPAGAVESALPKLQGGRGGPEIDIARCCTLVTIGRRKILIDPAGDGPDPSAALRNALAAVGVEPAEVDMVVLTHGHEDRVAGVTVPVGVSRFPAFPRARHFIHKAELRHLETAHRTDPTSRYGQLYARHIRPIQSAALLEPIQNGTVVASDGRASLVVVEAPGHTPGHVTVEMKGGSQHVLYASDIFHHPIQTLDPLIATANGDHDPAEALATRIATIARCVSEKTMVIGCHFPDAGAGQIAGAPPRFFPSA